MIPASGVMAFINDNQVETIHAKGIPIMHHQILNHTMCCYDHVAWTQQRSCSFRTSARVAGGFDVQMWQVCSQRQALLNRQRYGGDQEQGLFFIGLSGLFIVSDLVVFDAIGHFSRFDC